MRFSDRLPAIVIGDGILDENLIGLENAVPLMPMTIEPRADDLTTQPIGVNEMNQTEEVSQPNVPTDDSPDAIIFGRRMNAPSPNSEMNTNQNVANDNSQRSHSEQFMPVPPHHHPQIRHQSGARCPYAHRRLSTSNYHSLYPTNMRPAYAPHEMLWFRQQNNQEMLRRHYMNSLNEPIPSNTFGYVPNRMNNASLTNGICMSCDQQHPIGHPHRRRTHVCPLNLSSENPNPLIIR